MRVATAWNAPSCFPLLFAASTGPQSLREHRPLNRPPSRSQGHERLAHAKGVHLYHLGDPGHAVHHDPLDTGLEGLGGRRAGDARPVEFDGDDPGGLIHVDEFDIPLVSLDGRPDDLDDPLHFGLHGPSLAAPGTNSDPYLLVDPGATHHGAPRRPRKLAPMGLELVAHQGGWDEALLVAGPLLLFAGIVWNAKRRAVKQAQISTDEDA